MGTATVESIANEFLRIIEEGWTPDLDEFLHHVPQDMRAECRQRIQELTAPQAAPEPEPPPPPSGPRRLTREEARRMFEQMGV